MARDRRPKPPANAEATPKPAAEQSPLSLNRLRAAFAQMLGTDEPGTGSPGAGSKEQGASPTPIPQPTAPYSDPCEINPRTVVEATLFVGRPDNTPFSARELAAAMRGVSPGEIDAAVLELNALYEHYNAPYEIVGTATGYTLELRTNLRRMRDKLHGRTREAKLTPTAVEVLSIVAYNQPTTVESINDLRGATSGSVLQSLVRRKLVSIERPADRGEAPQYRTTDRFLRVFGLPSVAALPRSEELEKL